MADDFASQIRAIESGQQPAVAPPSDVPAAPRTFEEEIRQIETTMPPKQAKVDPNQIPSTEEINESALRYQRMEAFKAQIGELAINMANMDRVKKSAAQAPSGIAEKALSPVFDIGNALGGALRSGLSSKEEVANDPKVQEILGARPGVEFDTTGGVGFMDRLASHFTFNRAETAYSLMAANPNVQNVRFNSLGDPIVELKDPKTGKVKDILANPIGLDLNDATFLLAHAPDIVGGWYAAAGRNPAAVRSAAPVMRWLMSSESGPTAASARMALGTAAAGAPTDILARTAMEGSGRLPDVEAINPEGVIARRGTGAVADFLFGRALTAGGQAGTKVVSPFSRRGPIQMDAEAAQELWRREGVDYFLTPGEMTGSPMLLRTEALEAQKPGSSGVFSEIKQNRREQQLQIQRIMLGRDPSAVPAADLVGERALTAIGQRLRPLDTAVDRTTQDTLRLANQELQANLANATGIPSPVVQSAVGQNLIAGAEARHAAFETERNRLYDIVRNDPRVAGQGRNINIDDLAFDARGALDRIAAFERDINVPVTGAGGQPLVLPNGQPITRQVTEVNQLNALVDPKAIAGLEQMAQGQGARMGYADLIEARNTVGNAMRNMRALGGIPEARLEQFYAILSDKIRNGLTALDPSARLRQSWEAANDFTRRGMERLQQVDILPIFKDQTQRGSLDLYEVAGKALRDPGKWMAYREFFGANSPEMSGLRRLYADKLTGRTIGSDTIDMSSFSSRLKSAFDDPAQREILEDVFGANLRNAKSLADAGAALEKGGTVNTKELLTHLDRGTLTRRAVEDLQSIQELRELTYRNSLLQDMKKGNFEVDPAKFVDNFIFGSKADPKEVREALSLIGDPDVREGIALRTILRVFDESTEGLAGKEAIKSSRMNHFLKDNTDGNMLGSRIEIAIGGERFQQLKNARDLFRPEEEVQKSFSAAGGMAAGSQIAKWEEMLGNPKTTVGAGMDAAQRWLLSLGYAYGPIRRWIGNTVFGPAGSSASLIDQAALLNNLAGSAPAIENLTKLLGGEEGRYGRALAVHMKNKFDAQLREGQKQQGTNTPAAKPQGQ